MQKRVIYPAMLTMLLSALFWLTGCSISDLRDEQLKSQGISEHATQQGRQLLHDAAQKHGLNAWRAFTTSEAVFTDTWAGLMGKVMTHWPEAAQQAKMQAIVNTFTSRVELLDGEKKGEIWGIQAWAEYKQENAQAAAQFAPDDHIRFYLPTLQYFIELPFRALTAEYAAYMGEREYRGNTYDLVFITWGAPEPHMAADQYVIWINRSTGLIDLVHYTVRDAFRFVTGTMHYQDYREIQGVQVPFKQTVTMGGPGDAEFPLDENYMHQIILQQFSFDAVPRAAPLPDPQREPLGDRKPDAAS